MCWNVVKEDLKKCWIFFSFFLDDEHFIEIEDTPGYQTAYSQLNFLPKNNHDPLANIQDPKINLAQSLAKLSVGQPGLVTPLVAQTEPKVQEFLKVYMQNANVNLNWILIEINLMLIMILWLTFKTKKFIWHRVWPNYLPDNPDL